MQAGKGQGRPPHMPSREQGHDITRAENILLLCMSQVTNLIQKGVPYSQGVGYKVNLDGPKGVPIPYSLQEDFVSSYRMHPLLPDEYLIDGDEARPPLILVFHIPA